MKGRGEGEEEGQKKKGGECVGNRAKREAPRRNRTAREGRLQFSTKRLPNASGSASISFLRFWRRNRYQLPLKTNCGERIGGELGGRATCRALRSWVLAASEKNGRFWDLTSGFDSRGDNFESFQKEPGSTSGMSILNAVKGLVGVKAASAYRTHEERQKGEKLVSIRV